MDGRSAEKHSTLDQIDLNCISNLEHMDPEHKNCGTLVSAPADFRVEKSAGSNYLAPLADCMPDSNYSGKP